MEKAGPDRCVRCRQYRRDRVFRIGGGADIDLVDCLQHAAGFSFLDGPGIWHFQTPKATFAYSTSAAGPSQGYVVAISPSKNASVLVRLDIAPPSGQFVVGESFPTTGATADETRGQLAVHVTSAQPAVCNNEAGTITVNDASYAGTTLNRLAISFVDRCNGSTTPSATANLYAAEPVIAPIPQTVKFASPLVPAPGQGPTGGNVAGYHISGMPARQYVVVPAVTGISGTGSYVGVAMLRVDTNRDGRPDTTKSADVCTFTASGSGSDSCVGAVTIPPGTVAFGNTFAIERVLTAGSRLTVATGAFLQTQP